MLHRLPVVLLAACVMLGVAVDSATAQHFGRNKVQYRTFDFKIIQTDHFDIYYYPEEREAAHDAARFAERAYARLSRILQHEFKERKPIILYASHSEFQQTNAVQSAIAEGTGGLTEPLKDRIIMPFTGSYALFEWIFTHEMVHAFQFDVLYNQGSANQGGGVRLPLWFMEGMAEYLALGHVNVITSTFLRDAVLDGYMRDIAQMNRRNDYLSYRFGQALWAYIGDTWGDEVVGVLLQRAARMPMPRAFQMTLGISLEELSREWTQEVRKTYLPQTVRFDRPTEVGKPVLRHGALTEPSYLAPAISPDGETLAVFSTRDGFFPDLWLADAETGEFKRRLVRSGREADFKSLRYSNSSAAFSPDGERLAFTAQTGGRDALYIYDLEQEKVVRKLEFELNAISSPTWSPDGRRIAVSGNDGGVSDLFIVTLADESVERLTDDRYAELFPSWSPDGEAIAFSTDRSAATDFERLRIGNFRVALYHLDDGRIEVLPHQEKGSNLNPVWSPDSRSLVWVSDRTGVKNLFLYDRNDGGFYRMTNLLSGVLGPTATDLSPVVSWARDNERLAFVYFESYGNSVFTIDDPRRLTRVAVSDLPPEAYAPTFLAAADGEETTARADTAVALPDLGTGDTVDVAAIDVEEGFVNSYYRGDEDFRPSEVLPEATGTRGPISVLALMDSADYALPDTTGFEFRDYGVSFSPDVVGRPSIGAQVGGYYGNGVYGGSFISLSDMLGNHNILLGGNINGSFSDAMVVGSYSYLRQRANFGASFLQVPVYRYYGYGPAQLPNGDQLIANIFTRDVLRQAQGIMTYPFSTYRRFELGARATFYKRDIVYQGANLSQGGARVRESVEVGSASYYEPTAALVFDNTLFGYTGPIVGRRYRLQFSRTFGDAEFYEGLLDFRNYLNIDQTVVFASRLVGLVRTGNDANRFPNYWGGPYLLRGYDADSFEPTSEECTAYAGAEQSICPMRDQLIGSSAAIMNLEVRFPIITELQLGGLGRFPPVDAVAFFDGGVVWDNEVCLDRSGTDPLGCSQAQDAHLVWDRQSNQSPVFYREPLFSTGVGLRLNAFFAVVRLDYAWPLSRPDRGGVFSVSFGPSF